MWKLLCESVEGTSHRLAGSACQDSAFATPFSFEADQGLVLACSDGAGSAAQSQVGSALACRLAVERAMAFLADGHAVEDAAEDTLRAWVADVHAGLGAEAERLAVAPRELACTLLLAVVGRSAAAFVQVGDGAIVLLDGAAYRHVFWPHTGEYHNTTFFVTDPAFDQNVQCATLTHAIDELSLMSDGLQMLALDYGTRAVHQAFFGDLFRSLRSAGEPQDLIVPMRQWMDSDRVNGRTDDDKTLILATRVTTGGDAVI